MAEADLRGYSKDTRKANTKKTLSGGQAGLNKVKNTETGGI
jgi:hypothetical protein